MIKIANIIIHGTDGTQGTLMPSSESVPYIRNFAFQTPEGYNVIRILPMAIGIGGLTYGLRYILVTMQQNPTDATEQQVINVIKQQLSKFPQAKWTEGSNPMLDLIQKATGTRYTDNPDEVNMTEFPETEVRPLPSFVTVHTSPILGVLGMFYDSFDYRVKAIINSFEKAVKPLIDNNLLDFYEVYDDQRGVEQRIVWSERGKSAFDTQQSQENAELGYYKYVIQNVIAPRYPNVAETARYIVERYNMYKQISASATKINLQNSKVIRDLADQTALTKELNQAVVQMDDKKLAQFEQYLVAAKQHGIKPHIAHDLYGKMTEPQLNEILQESFYTSDPEAMAHLFSFYPQNVLPYYNFLNDTEFSELINSYRKQLSIVVTDIVRFMNREQRMIPEWLDKILPIYKYLSLPPDIVQQLEEANQKEQQRRQEETKRRNEEYRKQAFVVNWDYAVVDLNTMTCVPLRNYDGDDDLAEFLDSQASPIQIDLDRSDFYGEAEEELSADLEAKPSETYAENQKTPEGQKKIYQDILEDAQDFLDDQNFWETARGEELDQQLQVLEQQKEEAMAKVRQMHSQMPFNEEWAQNAHWQQIVSEQREISNRYLDQIYEIMATEIDNDDNLYEKYIQWKIQKMQSDEAVSDKYEIDEQELNERADELYRNALISAAYKQGMMTVEFEYDRGFSGKPDQLLCTIHKKYMALAKNAVKLIAEMNINTKDEMESPMSYKVPLSIFVLTKDNVQLTETRRLRDWLRESTATSWLTRVKTAKGLGSSKLR